VLTVTETQRETVPRIDTSELDTALAFLDFARASVLKKLDGLSEEQVRRVLVPTGTTLLGLVRHMIDGERYWFGYTVAGQGARDDWDFTMDVEPGRSAQDVVAELREAIAASNQIVRDIGDPQALTANPVDDRPLSLRWVIAHMTSEAARHAGHADILREHIDGTTGR
jgi:uncharacterized damage-inducible protein DinB